jgi:nucleoid DNA-binding protein
VGFRLSIVALSGRAPSIARPSSPDKYRFLYLERKESIVMTDKSRSTSGRGYGKLKLIEDVTAQTQGYTRHQVAEIIEAALYIITQQVAAGQNVTLTGFGTFRPSQRAARMGTDLRSRETIRIPAQASVHFKVGDPFKAAVARGQPSRPKKQR